MGRKNTGVIRQSCMIVSIGLALFVVSVLADLPESTYITDLVGGLPLPVWITSIVSPIFLFSGLLTMTIGFKKMFTKLTE